MEMNDPRNDKMAAAMKVIAALIVAEFIQILRMYLSLTVEGWPLEFTTEFYIFWGIIVLMVTAWVWAREEG